MGRPLYTNNAATYLAFGITNTATTMQVSANAGNLFPNPTGGDYFYVSLISLSGPIIEIVKCTARSGDIFTIERGQEGTTPLYWNMGDNVQLRITAAGMNYIAGAAVQSTEEQVFTATQGQTVFTLTNFDYAPGTNNLAVFVNGSKQVYGTNYSETSVNTVTFNSGLNAGDIVEFLVGISVASGTLYANEINYNEGGVGAVTTTVQAKLQEFVSVKDFGAVGDGTTDDTTAFTNAISYCTSNNLCLYAPSSASFYKITSSLNITCAFSAGLYLVFGGSGTITFAANTIETVYSKWFSTGDTAASVIYAAGNVPNWVQANTGLQSRITDIAPVATTYQEWISVKGQGYPNQAKGVGALRIDVSDTSAVASDSTKKGILYGIVMTIDPLASRNNIPYDDATGILIQNGGTQKATDAFYVGNGTPSTVQWNSILSCDATSVVGISLNAYMQTYGIDLANGSYGYSAIRIPNSSHITARNAANTDDVPLLWLNNNNNIAFGSASWPINVIPFTDNTQSLGLGSNRYSVVYAGTGTINTSDGNEKTEVVEISDAEKRVALKLKSLVKRFKYKDAVLKKQNNARYHFGVIAQDVKTAFESEGLVAEQYGIFCSDTLEDGAIRLGVRYEELLAFVISAI